MCLVPGACYYNGGYQRGRANHLAPSRKEQSSDVEEKAHGPVGRFTYVGDEVKCQSHADFELSSLRKKNTMLDKEASKSLEGLEIGALHSSEVGEVVNVVARGFRDNPVGLAVFGVNPERRLHKMYRFISAAFALKDYSSHTLVARRGDGTIVGVCGMLPPGNCLPTFTE